MLHKRLNKRGYPLYLLCSLFIFLVGCSDGAKHNKPVSFDLNHRYIDFHSLTADISASRNVDVAIVVSTSSSPRNLTGSRAVEEDSKIKRHLTKNVLTNIHIAWTDEFTFHDLANRINLAGGTHSLTINSASDYIPWVLQPATTYYLHVYYNGDESKGTATFSFTTKSYPTSSSELSSFSSTPNGLIFNLGKSFEIKRSSEPIAYSFMNIPSDAGFTVTNQSSTVGIPTLMCAATLGNCSSAFSSHLILDIRYNVPNTTAFTMRDVVLFINAPSESVRTTSLTVTNGIDSHSTNINDIY